MRPSAVDTEPYHARVRTAAASLPYSIGSWIGMDTPVPESARALLKPNVIVSRRYHDFHTGQEISLLLVQCKDARDLAGHYPPICYVGQGWTQTAASKQDWPVGETQVNGMIYQFVRTVSHGRAAISVGDFMILPNGQTVRDMAGVYAAAKSPKRRFFGAAQMQLIFEAAVPEEQQKEITDVFLAAAAPVIDAIRGGENP